MISHSAFLLGYPDSNQERQDQNLQCYHYTISQCCFAKFETVVPCLRVQRYKLFLNPARKSRKIFKKNRILAVLREKLIKKCNFWDFWGEISRIMTTFVADMRFCSKLCRKVKSVKLRVKIQSRNSSIVSFVLCNGSYIIYIIIKKENLQWIQ